MVEASGTVLDFFATVEDPRQRGKVVYRLDEILLIVLAGCLAGADNMVEMAGFARLNLEALQQIRPFARGVPSHDTLTDVVNALDPGTFEECFEAWIGAIRPDGPDLIAIDGKTSRRTGHARTGQRPLHTLSAYAREQRLVLAQEVVDGKSNERTLIPSLLDKLRLKGSLVTIDAAGSYRPIAEQIVEAGADYLLTVKANQPKLLARIKAALEQAAPETVQRCETEDTAHGRQERRRCTLVPAPAGLGGKTPWAGLQYVAAVEGTAVRDGKVTTLTRYYITSRTLTATQLLEAVRGHWSIENSVHWVLDVVFGDDYSRLRSQYGPRNMALVQRIALNLIKHRSSGTDSLTVKRKKAGWSVSYLIETITGLAA
jgi:predicted transposase YbfD/YdcC